MMIKLDKESTLIVKESLDFEENIMKLSVAEYEKKMKEFEKKYNMKTKSFIEKFNSGELGDDSEWFDWLFAFKAYQHIKDRINRIASIFNYRIE